MGEGVGGVKIIAILGKIILRKMCRNLNSKWRCVNTSIQKGPGLKLGFPGKSGCFCVNILFSPFWHFEFWMG